MTAYVVAHVHDAVEFGPDIVEYLERIDATLEPYYGRFLVHGGAVETLEGTWGEDLIVISFPDRDLARAWYESPAYQEIAPLRAKHMVMDLIIATGTPEGYKGADALAR